MMFKERYKKFQQWQRQPIQYQKSEENHFCNNCGLDYTGDFCPACGQKHTMGPVTWDSIRTGIMELWGMGTRSLPYTLLQLIFRPGYLIGDYISGRRQVSFPPVKMLVLVGLAVFLIGKFGGLELFDSTLGMAGVRDNENTPFSQLLSWLAKHYDWASLFLYLAMALPTYFMFRYSPRHSYHTLPQEFFIQVFNSTQFLCVGFIWVLLLKLLGIEDTNMNLTKLILFPLLLFYNYKQLFGYGFWGTFWRLLCCYWLWMITLFAIMNIDEGIIHLRNNASVGQVMKGFRLFIVPVGWLALSLFVFYVFNTWNKPFEKMRKKKTIVGNITLIVTATISFLSSFCVIGSIEKWIEDHDIAMAIGAAIFLILFIITFVFLYSHTKKRQVSMKKK